MEGAADSLNYAFRSFAGVISDRIASRKPLVIVGYALSTVAKPFFSVTSNFAMALVVRLTDRAGKGIRTSPRDALISDSVKETVSGRLRPAPVTRPARRHNWAHSGLLPHTRYRDQEPIPYLTLPMPVYLQLLELFWPLESPSSTGYTSALPILCSDL